MSSTVIFVAESFVYISICGYFAFLSRDWVPVEYLNIAISTFAIPPKPQNPFIFLINFKMQQSGFTPMPAFSKAHTQAWMDIQIGQEGQKGYHKQRIVIELF